MTTVLVPVRYPLTTHSEATLREAVQLAEDEDGELIVLHVNLYQGGNEVSRGELRRAVERAVGRLPYARYQITRGFLVEETILEEIASERADYAVIGHNQISRWRRAFNRLVDNHPDVASFLEDRVDCEVVVVETD